MRTYTLTVEDDGVNHSQTSKAIGYNALELIGILYLEMENVKNNYVMETNKEIRERIEAEGMTTPPKYTEPPSQEWLDAEPHERSMTGD